MDKKYDLIVIGGGPGGTDAAEEAADKGLKTAVIERDLIGGTCLNRGCVPTKTILHAAEVYRQAKEGKALGITGQGDLDLDAARLQTYKEETLETLRSGLTYTMERSKVELISGEGKIIDGDEDEDEDLDLALA